MKFTQLIYPLAVGLVIASNNKKNSSSEEAEQKDVSETKRSNTHRNIDRLKQLQGLSEDWPEFLSLRTVDPQVQSEGTLFGGSQFKISERLNDFFPLEGTSIKVNTEIQREILELLRSNQVKDVIQFGIFPKSKDNTQEIDSKIVDVLRNEVVNKHREELMKILAKIPKLGTLQEFSKKASITSYRELCNFIPKTITFEELKKATNDGKDIFMVCPDDFFSLDRGIEVGESMQKDIFELLLKREIVDALVYYGYHQQSKLGIKKFISNTSWCLERLREAIWKYHDEELLEILSQVPGLSAIKEFWGKETISSYEGLCKFISRVRVYGRVKKATSNWQDTSRLYPDGFFSLDGVVKVEESIQKDIFGLVKMDEIAEACNTYGLDELTENDVKDLISNQWRMKKLCDKVVRNHKLELAKLLAKVPELGAIVEVAHCTNWCDYNNLCHEIIPQAIVWGELNKATNGGLNIDEVYPRDFFPIVEKADEFMQKRIFRLLSKYDMACALVDCGYLKQNECEIKEAISLPGCMRCLRDTIVRLYRYELEGILRKIPGLEKLSMTSFRFITTYRELKMML